MRIAFAGTPEFAATALQALLAANMEIVLVLTQPDRPAGRGLAARHSAVKQVALAAGLPLAQPQSMKDAASGQLLRAARADLLVVAAYGLILPQAVLDIPTFGCLNIHASLLPRWRGAAPIQRAIEAGDTDTGISIMRMDAGLDTGPVLMMASVPITAQATAASLHDDLAALGARLIVRAVRELPTLQPQEQSSVGVLYAKKIEKAEAVLDWQLPARVLERRIRAYTPTPGAITYCNGLTLKIHAATLNEEADVKDNAGIAAGTVITSDAQGIQVMCGDGTLTITQLQKAGGKRLAAIDFLRGHPLPKGAVFTWPAAL